MKQNFDIKMLADKGGGSRLLITNRETQESRVVNAILRPGENKKRYVDRLTVVMADVMRAMKCSRTARPEEVAESVNLKQKKTKGTK